MRATWFVFVAVVAYTSACGGGSSVDNPDGDVLDFDVNLATGQCTSTSCTGGQVCNTNTGRCIPCSNDDNCKNNSAGNFCDIAAGKCVKCAANGDCTSGLVCASGACGKCTADSQCTNGTVCNTGTGACVQCKSNAQCSAPLTCVTGNVCGKCSKDSDCTTSGTACASDGRCLPTKCVTPPYATTNKDDGWRNIYWGSLHEHTSWSLDAYFKNPYGGNSYSPDGAYQFAQGKIGQTIVGTDKPVTLKRGVNSLDWVAITDHAEYFDNMQACVANTTTSSGIYTSNFCTKFRGSIDDAGVAVTSNNGFSRQNMLGVANPQYVCSNNLVSGDSSYACPNWSRMPSTPLECGKTNAGQTTCDTYQNSMWVNAQNLADQYNEAGFTDACGFATLNAFEYSSNYDANSSLIANMHRNIIFRQAGKAKTGTNSVTTYPLDYITYPTTSKLWAALNAECPPDGSKPCKKAMSIPHNPNDSAGHKWDIQYDVATDGTTKDNGLLRSKFEKLVEVHQHKGSSECLNESATGTEGVNGYDSTCEFELGTTTTADATGAVSGVPNRAVDRVGYVRPGNAKGLLQYQTSKFNPLQLGMIGATDSHNSTPGYTPEKDWKGHTGTDDNRPEVRLRQADADGNPNTMRYWNSGGLTAVHAKRNVREDIYDALDAREVYGTSGTRMRLWLFMLPDSDTTTNCANFPNDPLGVAAALRKANAATGATCSKDADCPSGQPCVSNRCAFSGAMGSAFKTKPNKFRFLVYVSKDPQFPASDDPLEQHDLAEIDLIQTSVVDNGTKDLVFRLKLPEGAKISGACNIFSSDTATAPYGTSTANVTQEKLAAALVAGGTTPHLWYARALETVSHSWRYYDCKSLEGSANDCKVIAPDFCGTIDSVTQKCKFDTNYTKVQERAWSSPIWYMP